MSFTDLQNKVEQKLGSIGSALDALMEKQNVFDSNYEKIINNFKMSVEHQIKLIKERETQCLKALEDAASRQKNVLNSQMNSLMQKRDSLLETQKLLQHYKGNNVEALTKLFNENLERMEMDEDYNKDQLQKSIQDFMFSEPTPNFQPVSVTFPRLPQNVWLAYSKHEPAVTEKCCKESKVCKDLSVWLAGTKNIGIQDNKTVRQNPEVTKNSLPLSLCENYYQSNGNFPGTPRDGRSRRSSISSSIEIVSSPDSHENAFSTTEDDYINIKKRWLSGESTASNKDASSESIAIEEFACQANERCKSYDDCLFDGYCKRLANERALQTAQWLNKTQDGNREQKACTTDASSNKATSVPLNDAICAQSLKEGREKVLRHMAEIMASETEKWLSKNLSKETPVRDVKIQKSMRTPVLQVTPVSSLTSSSPQVASKLCPKTCVTYKAPCKSWLLKRPLSGTKNNIDAVLHPHASHQNTWLLRKHKESTVQKEDLPEMPYSKACFDVGDIKGALAELSVLIPQHFPPLENDTFQSLLQTCPPIVTDVSSSTPKEETGKDVQRKLEWLSGDRSRVPIPGHVSLVTEPPLGIIPDSLMGLVENFDKWLMKKL